MPAGAIEPVQLTQLAAELEVLLRRGAPLGSGLLHASGNLNRRLGPAVERLAIRLESGVPVDEALRTSPDLPPVFRSLAAASLGTNRGADILKAWSDSTRQLHLLRETLVRGLMYPAIIVILTYGLFVLVVRDLLPQLASIVAEFSDSPPWWTELVDWLRATLPIWSWAVPVAVIVLWLLVQAIFGRGQAAGWWGRLPFVQRTVRDLQTSTASRLLGALLECETPLPLALSLASESLATPAARDAVNAVADDLRQGIPADAAFRSRTGAPPLWRALFVRDSAPAAVRSGLNHVAEVLAERAQFRMDVLGRAIPIMMVVGLGGAAVFGYGVTVFGPLISVWNRIGGTP